MQFLSPIAQIVNEQYLQDWPSHRLSPCNLHFAWLLGCCTLKLPSFCRDRRSVHKATFSKSLAQEMSINNHKHLLSIFDVCRCLLDSYCILLHCLREFLSSFATGCCSWQQAGHCSCHSLTTGQGVQFSEDAKCGRKCCMILTQMHHSNPPENIIEGSNMFQSHPRNRISNLFHCWGHSRIQKHGTTTMLLHSMLRTAIRKPYMNWLRHQRVPFPWC